MRPLTSRQADILRLVLALGRPNVNDFVRGGRGSQGQSPSKLKHNLDQLVGEHCLRMDPVGNEHRYTITKMGRSRLFKYEAETTGDSIASVGARLRLLTPEEIKKQQEAIKKLQERMRNLERVLERLEQNDLLVKTTWCRRCGGTDREVGFLDDVETEMCSKCHASDFVYGTLAEHAAFMKEKGLAIPS